MSQQAKTFAMKSISGLHTLEEETGLLQLSLYCDMCIHTQENKQCKKNVKFLYMLKAI